MEHSELEAADFSECQLGVGRTTVLLGVSQPESELSDSQFDVGQTVVESSQLEFQGSVSQCFGSRMRELLILVVVWHLARSILVIRLTLHWVNEEVLGRLNKNVVMTGILVMPGAEEGAS